jgi:hypothetical protein
LFMLKVDDLNGVHGRFRKIVKIIDPSTRLLERKKGDGPLRVRNRGAQLDL